MDKENNNKRTANYTKEECWRLIEIIEKLAHIIENKKTDALTWKDKKAAWQKVCLQFNALGTQNRTWEQLTYYSKYETLKKETRRAIAKSRTDVLGTGGGPYEIKINPLHEKIRAMIKLSAEGIPSCFDSDYIGAETMGSTSASTSFITHIVTDARDNVNSVLQEEAVQVADILPVFISKEANSDASNEEVAEATPKKTLPIAPSIVERYSEADTAEVNDWTSYCPAQLKRSKHPALQTLKRKRLSGNSNISTAGQKMQPWLDAKTELTSLKVKLIQDEFNARQERERELHEDQLQLNRQQIQINELIIEKLKLEIEEKKKQQ